MALYQILKVRSEVFVVEQVCIYQDIDEVDLSAFHIYQSHDEKVIAYARCIPPNNKPFSQIGRVLVASDARGQGLAKQLMQTAIEFNFKQWPDSSIKISAQTYLIKFYQSLGFELVSEAYLEDGIPHQDMILNISV